jgi:hypothetical protein
VHSMSGRRMIAILTGVPGFGNCRTGAVLKWLSEADLSNSQLMKWDDCPRRPTEGVTIQLSI